MSDYSYPSVTPTVSAGTNVYTANDVVGGLLTFNVGLQSGLIKTILVHDGGNVKAQLGFTVYRSAPSAIADNAPFAPSDADSLKAFIVDTVYATDYISQGTLNAVATKKDVNRSFTSADGNLYMYQYAAGTPVYGSASDITVELEIWPSA